VADYWPSCANVTPSTTNLQQIKPMQFKPNDAKAFIFFHVAVVVHGGIWTQKQLHGSICCELVGQQIHNK